MTNCEKTGELLEAYADKQATAKESRVVAEHLEGCAGCRKTLRWIQASKAALRGVPAPAMPADLKARLLREARRRRPSPAAGWLAELGRVLRGHPWEAGAAAAFAAAGVLVAVRSSSGPVEDLPLSSVLEAHNEYARTMPFAAPEQLLDGLPAAREGRDAL